VAQQPKPPKPAARDYYLLDPRIGDELAPGIKVITRERNRVVRLALQQAQYFLDNGVLGEKPYVEHSDDEKEVLAQVTRVPKA
jgi:hypothetical protein